jgi:hypothetical protein
VARHGWAGHGAAGSGKARQGEDNFNQRYLKYAWPGWAGLGKAVHGKAGQGSAWQLFNSGGKMEQLKKEPIYLQAVDDATTRFTYGDVIPIKWLHDNLNIKIPDVASAQVFQEMQFAFLSRFDSFRQEMLESHKMLLVNVRSEGYKICEPEVQTDTAMKKLKKKLSKELSRAETAMSYIRFSLLSDEAKRANVEALAKLSAIKQMSRRKLAQTNIKHLGG